VLAGFIVVLGLLLALPWLVPPERVADLLLHQIGSRLQLDITRHGPVRWQLRGGPFVELHALEIGEREAETAWLHAERVLVAVPWRSVRALGKEWALTRLEVDAPTLDLPALRHWLDKRPPGRGEIPWPTLSNGLAIRAGRIQGDGWQLASLALALPHFGADSPLRGQLSGEYSAANIRIEFDLHPAMTQVATGAGVAIVGTLEMQRDALAIPVQFTLSGPVHVQQGQWRIPKARLALDGQFSRPGLPALPFALAATGALDIGERMTLSGLALDLTGHGPLPSLHAAGNLNYDNGQLSAHLQGELPHWPALWPALPPPLNRQRSPLEFRLDYTGAADFSGPLELHLQRAHTRLNATIHPQQLLTWFTTHSPRLRLPPLHGHLTTPALELPGVSLYGVEIEAD